MNDEQLEYIGPTSIDDGADEITEADVKDEQQLGTLEKLERVIAARMRSYRSVEAIDLTSKVMTPTEQIAVNKLVLSHLQEFQSLVVSAINDVKERTNGR